MKVIPTSEDEYKKVFLEVPMIAHKDNKRFTSPFSKVKNTIDRQIKARWRKKTSFSFAKKYERYIYIQK